MECKDNIWNFRKKRLSIVGDDIPVAFSAANQWLNPV